MAQQGRYFFIKKRKWNFAWQKNYSMLDLLQIGETEGWPSVVAMIAHLANHGQWKPDRGMQFSLLQTYGEKNCLTDSPVQKMDIKKTGKVDGDGLVQPQSKKWDLCKNSLEGRPLCRPFSYPKFFCNEFKFSLNLFLFGNSADSKHGFVNNPSPFFKSQGFALSSQSQGEAFKNDEKKILKFYEIPETNVSSKSFNLILATFITESPPP